MIIDPDKMGISFIKIYSLEFLSLAVVTVLLLLINP